MIGYIVLIISGLIAIAIIVAILTAPLISIQNKINGTEGWFQRKPKNKTKRRGE